jgi:hypothetical protein
MLTIGSRLKSKSKSNILKRLKEELCIFEENYQHGDVLKFRPDTESDILTIENFLEDEDLSYDLRIKDNEFIIYVGDHNICDICNFVDPTVERIADPFMEEIHEKEIYRLYCNECYRQRKEEI